MNCFYFKGKSKSKKRAESSPELQRRDKPGTSGMSERPSNSLGSLPSTPKSIPELFKEKEHTLRVFSYEELREATCGFNKMLKIGEGGFGSVYKGTVKPVNGRGQPLAVAIKKLKRKSLQGHKEWMSEIQFLSIVAHPNLVKLLGYCSDETEHGLQLLLVYEYMAKRSLDDHLFSRSLPPIPWKTRLEIILGAAQGLAHLHDGMEIKVIFRDFKSSNVLLDNDFNAKLSDFGMVREGPVGDHTHVTTRIIGTFGYAAPEYVETGHLTIHSDIWTFGIVLYEIITGRRAVERSRPANEQKLLDWVKRFPVDSQRFSMIIDPKLRGQYSLTSARKVARLAEMCLIKNHKDRPTMGQIISVLKDAIRDCNGANSSGSKSLELSSRSKADSPVMQKKITSY